jgi:predicted nuclease of restriction endonuclease-like RecB superfamily
MRELGSGDFHVAGEKVDVAEFLSARLTRQNPHERRLAIHKQVQRGVDRGKIVESIEAIGADAKFARSLRAAEKQDAEQSDLVAVKIEDLREAVFELGDAAIGCSGTREALLIQRIERAANRVFVKVHYRITI